MFCTGCGSTVADGTAFCPSCGTRLGSSSGAVQPAPAFAPAVGAGPVMDYATWGNRALGYLVDSLLVGAVVAIIYALAGGMLAAMAGAAGREAASGMCCLLLTLFPLASLAVGVYNRVYLVSQRGYSIGQGLVHIKVVDASGNLLTRQTALIRLLAQVGLGLIPFLSLIDLLWPLWDERRQTLHDKAVNSYVINNAAQ